MVQATSMAHVGGRDSKQNVCQDPQPHSYLGDDDHTLVDVYTCVCVCACARHHCLLASGSHNPLLSAMAISMFGRGRLLPQIAMSCFLLERQEQGASLHVRTQTLPGKEREMAPPQKGKGETRKRQNLHGHEVWSDNPVK